MERRSRSQVRRVENAALAGGGLGSQTAHSRHASSTRVAEPMMLNGGVEQGARTLSPDRKDRYRASGRGGGGYVYDMSPTAGGVPPSHHMLPAATGSNANSYNQYNNSSQSYGAGGYGSSPPSSLLPQHSPVKAPAVTADNGGSLQVSSAVQVHHYSFSASPPSPLPLLIFLLLLTGDFPRLDATDGRVLGVNDWLFAGLIGSKVYNLLFHL